VVSGPRSVGSGQWTRRRSVVSGQDPWISVVSTSEGCLRRAAIHARQRREKGRREREGGWAARGEGRETRRTRQRRDGEGGEGGARNMAAERAERDAVS
jgi:hypothetical protein